MTREEASAYIARLNRDEKLRLLNMLIAISKISPQEKQETMNMVDNPHGNGGTAEVSV